MERDVFCFSSWLVKYWNEQTEPCISRQEPGGLCFLLSLLIEIDKNENVCKWGFLPNLARFEKVLTSSQVLSPNALYTQIHFLTSVLTGPRDRPWKKLGALHFFYEQAYSVIYFSDPAKLQVADLPVLKLKNWEEKIKPLRKKCPQVSQCQLKGLPEANTTSASILLLKNFKIRSNYIQ